MNGKTVAGLLWVTCLATPSDLPAQSEGIALLNEASKAPRAIHYELGAKVARIQHKEHYAARVTFLRRDDGCAEYDANRKYLGTRVYPSNSEKLFLNWTGNDGPVPLCEGQDVTLRVLPNLEIGCFTYCLQEVRAARRGPNGMWEFIGQPISTRHLVRYTPRSFNVEMREVRWAPYLGIIIAGLPDGEYGAGDELETDTGQRGKPGWLISNQPGFRVVVGRDGWSAWFDGAQDSISKMRKWMNTEVPNSQRLPSRVGD